MYKRKGNPKVSEYHRGISRLSVAGTNLLNSLNVHLHQTAKLFVGFHGVVCGVLEGRRSWDTFEVFLSELVASLS